jgi:hypothetical protein
MLGLTTAGTALSTDDMALAGRGAIDGRNPVLAEGGKNLAEGVATALENLAKAIRDGEAQVLEMKIESALTPNDYVSHDLRVRLEMLRDTE